MGEVFEALMVICFGISWPISIIRSIRSKSTKGKSPFFLAIIMSGYVFGIIGKFLTNKIHPLYVFIFYWINLCMVTTDFVIYFINRKRERGANNELLSTQE